MSMTFDEFVREQIGTRQTERYVHDRALYLFRERKMTLDDAILIAASELEQQRKRPDKLLSSS